MSTPARLAQVQQHLAAPSAAPPHSTRAASSKAARPKPPTASEFRFFLPMQTRWNDNDQYGHMNNAVYAFYFDSITNYYLLHHALPAQGERPLGLIVNSHTTYASSLAYPQPVVAALSVTSLSARSLTWRVALFAGEYVPAPGDEESWSGFALADLEGGGAGRRVRLKRGEGEGGEPRAAAWGEMVHVFVEPHSRRPVKALDEAMRSALQRLVVDAK